MADITMCSGIGCPLREDCLRHKSKPSINQSYFMYMPYNWEKRDCEYKITINETSKYK